MGGTLTKEVEDSLARCTGCFDASTVEEHDDMPDPKTPEISRLRRDSSQVPATSEMLLEAAEAGDCKTVESIIAAGTVDLDAVDSVDDYTAVLAACEAGNIDVVKALHAAGASLDVCDSYGRTPLYAAAVAGHRDVVSHLIDAGADARTLDHDGRGAFWACCAVRRVDVAELLLAEGKCNIDQQPAGGESALDFAVKHGHADVIEFLRNHGCVDQTAGRLSMG